MSATPRPSDPSATEAFGYAWALAKRNFASVILPLAVGLVLTMVINIALNLMLLPVKIALGIKAGIVTGFGLGAVLDAAVAVPATAVSAFFGAGFYRFSSRLVRGQKPSFGEVFSGAQVFGVALAATLGTIGLPTIVLPLLRLAPFVGSALGLLLVFAGGMAWPWALAVAIDRGLGGAQAITAGWAEATKALGTSLVLMLFGGLGVFACCVGMFVTMPLMQIAVAYVYHCRKGDAVALAPPG